MEVVTERSDGILWARVSGRIDGTNFRKFEESINSVIEADDRAVIVDLEKLHYISSAGLRTVLMIARNLKRREAAFSLCALTDVVQQIFECTGFDEIITIHPTKADALASVDH